MTEIVGDWLLYTGCEPKRRRAKLACLFCHSKKIKCDLQIRMDMGCDRCSKCDVAGRECRLRAPKRGRRCLPSSGTATTPGCMHDDLRLRRASVTSSSCGGGGGTGERSGGGGLVCNTAVSVADHGGFEYTRAQPSSRKVAGSSPLTPTAPAAAAAAPVSSLPLPHMASIPSVSSGSPPEGAGRSHGGDVDTGFLQVYGPEHEIDAIRQEQEARQLLATKSATASGSAGSAASTAAAAAATVSGAPAPPPETMARMAAAGSLATLSSSSQSSATRPSAASSTSKETATATMTTTTSTTTTTTDTSAVASEGGGSFADSDDAQQQELLQSFAETYFSVCYPWCPVLDRATLADELPRSPLLANALALAASHVQPPLVPHEGPAAYYQKATSLFYHDAEADTEAALKALALFYWWAPRPPTTAHRHSSWWWTSVIIRHAQQMNFHREPAPDHPLRHRMNLSLRRRIWWTAFARERITALCQSKPCIIDPDDCSISPPTLADFPDDGVSQRQGEIFIHWVRLSAIMGRAAKVLSRMASSSGVTGSGYNDPLYSSGGDSSAAALASLRQELVLWVQSLPAHLQLPIGKARTDAFDRDVHQLHLPYLTTVIVLHLHRASPQALPRAQPAAILAASCIARILRDVMARGNVRFLMAVTCWYSAMAFIALLQASRVRELAAAANSGLDVLVQTIGELKHMWASANVIGDGFDRLRRSFSGPPPGGNTGRGGSGSKTAAATNAATNSIQYAADPDDLWVDLFPFVTPETNKIAEVLLEGREHGVATRLPSPDNMLMPDVLFSQYQGLLEPWADYMFDVFDTDVGVGVGEGGVDMSMPWAT